MDKKQKNKIQNRNNTTRKNTLNNAHQKKGSKYIVELVQVQLPKSIIHPANTYNNNNTTHTNTTNTQGKRKEKKLSKK